VEKVGGVAQEKKIEVKKKRGGIQKSYQLLKGGGLFANPAPGVLGG